MELFKTWKKNMVLYGLKSQIGTVYRNNDRTTSFYDVGNFLYLAGELDSRFWEDFVRKYGLDYKIILIIIFITAFLRKNGHRIYRGILSPIRILF
ncbi:GNAT family acetyltransferase [Streptococcus pneumoniae]|nr:GNAT family acetyltransferase [Streptococcus pneumoniae]